MSGTKFNRFTFSTLQYVNLDVGSVILSVSFVFYATIKSVTGYSNLLINLLTRYGPTTLNMHRINLRFRDGKASNILF